MTQVLIVHADDTAELADITGSDMERADQFRAVLDGYMESVRGGECFAYADEDGKHQEKPINRLATILAWRLGYPGIVFLDAAGKPTEDHRATVSMMRGSDFLVGTVIFYGGIVVRGEDGFEQDVTPKVLAVAREIGIQV